MDLSETAAITNLTDVGSPGEEPAHRLLYAVGRFDRALRGELKLRMRSLDLTIPEFTTLTVLRYRKGLSNAQLARRALVSPQAMNQVLSSLEQKGLVRRSAEPDSDGRAHHRARSVGLTPEGEHHANLCDEIVETVEDAAFRALNQNERQMLAGLLRGATEELRGGLAEPPAEAHPGRDRRRVKPGGRSAR